MEVNTANSVRSTVATLVTVLSMLTTDPTVVWDTTTEGTITMEVLSEVNTLTTVMDSGMIEVIVCKSATVTGVTIVSVELILWIDVSVLNAVFT